MKNENSKIARWGQEGGPAFSLSKVFDGSDEGAILSTEVRNARLSGRLVDQRSAPHCNIVDSLLIDIEVDAVDFTRCDFKGTTIRNSHFRRTKLGFSTFAQVTIDNSTFAECDFPDTAMHDCEFRNVTFVDCDFSNILIKMSNFESCSFDNCKTNNKVFETSRFYECRFDNSQIQIETIEENYGLVSSYYKGQVRDGRSDEAFRQLPVASLAERLKRPETHPLRRLNIYYFLKETLIEGSEYLDEALNVESWSSRWFRSLGAFAADLNQWVTFLLSLFDRDQLLALTLIRLHSTTGQLAEGLSLRELNGHAVSLIYGSHSALSRTVQTYLDALEYLDQAVSERMVLVVEGGGDPNYYERELAPLFERCEGRVVSLTPHNSPWDLVIEFVGKNHLFFLALLLATRLRFEIYRVSTIAKDATVASELRGGPNSGEPRKKRSRKGAQPVPRDTVFEISLPTGGPPPQNPILRWNPFLSTNLALDLQVDVGSKVAAHIKSIIPIFPN
jgi:hypothetical protein